MMDNPSVLALVVEFDWGVVDGLYTPNEIESFMCEYVGPPEKVTVFDPRLFSELFVA